MVSGNTIRPAPSRPAACTAAHTFSVVPARLPKTGAICTAAARTLRLAAIDARLERPGVEDERVRLAVKQDEVEHVERVDRLDAGYQRGLRLAVQRRQR